MNRGTSGLSRRAFLEKAGQTIAGASLLGVASEASPAEAPDPQVKSDKTIRIGVVGGGFGASFHWHQDPNCIVEAVSDLRTDRRDHLMRFYRCPRSYESLEKLILDKSIDAVAVFTGAPDHPSHVIACMNAGKHAISAVPACLTLEQAQQMKEIKEKTGLKYMMAETSYYRSECIAARGLYQDGKFGEIFYSEVEYYHPHNEAGQQALWFFNGQRTWRYGFPPMLYPTHSTGFTVGVTSERLTEVSCLGFKPADSSYLEGNVYKNPFSAEVALFKTNRGNICRANVAWEGTAHGERAQWFGQKMTMYMPGSGYQPFAVQGHGAPQWAGVPDLSSVLPVAMRSDSGHGGSHPFITHEFVVALCEDREPAIDLYESLAMTVPGIVAHESALKGGEQMKVPSFDKA